MPNDILDPATLRTVGNNLLICLRLIGSRPESLALRCKIPPETIFEYTQGRGRLSQDLLNAFSRDVTLSRGLLLKEFQTTTEAEKAFGDILRRHGTLIATSLIGATEKGMGVMQSQPIAIPPGKLNDPEWRRNFGLNIRVSLQHLNMTPASLGVRTDISNDNVARLIAGNLSLTNDDVEAIRTEIGLSLNDITRDYIDDSRRSSELLSRLQAAGRIKENKPEPTTAPKKDEPPVAAPAAAVPSETLPPAAQPQPAEEPTTSELSEMVDEDDVIWEDDTSGTAGDTTYDLRNKELRKKVAANIKKLWNEHYPDYTAIEFFARVKHKNVAWLNNLNQGSATLHGADIKAFATFFNVSALMILAGTGQKPVPVPGHLTWSDDGSVATEEATGRTFDLTIIEVAAAIVDRIKRLSPAGLTVRELLEECLIEQPDNWLDEVVAGRAELEEADIEAFAEFFAVEEIALLSGEGLIFPTAPATDPETANEPTVSTSAEAEADEVESEATEPTLEPAPPVEVAHPSDTPEESVSTDQGASLPLVVEAEQPVSLSAEAEERVAAFQEHFKQRLLETDFELADNVTPRQFLAKTLEPNVDWCTLFHTMTREGNEILAKIEELAEQIHPGDNRLALRIMELMLMRRLHMQ